MWHVRLLSRLLLCLLLVSGGIGNAIARAHLPAVASMPAQAEIPPCAGHEAVPEPEAAQQAAACCEDGFCDTQGECRCPCMAGTTALLATLPRCDAAVLRTSSACVRPASHLPPPGEDPERPPIG